MRQDFKIPDAIIPYSLSRRAFLKLALQYACLPYFLTGLGANAAIPRQASSLPAKSWIVSIHQAIPNDAIQLIGKPGSLMKLFTTMLLLENGLVHPDRPFDCTGKTSKKLSFGNPLHCSHAHGVVTLSDAIALSCNAYFVQAVQHVSISQFSQLWPQCFPNRPIKTPPTYHTLTSYLLGYSPEVQLSAADILAWMRTLATRGENHALLAHISPNTWAMLYHAMRSAARWGTGQKADPKDHYELALKTGTTAHGQTYQSWAAGFFPADNPHYIFCTRAFRGTSEASAIPALRTALGKYSHAT